MSKVTIEDLSIVPIKPGTNEVSIYSRGGTIYKLDDAGVETSLEGGGTGTGAYLVEDIPVSSDGETVFILSASPSAQESTLLTVNGQVLHPVDDYTITGGNTLTYINTSYQLETVDSVKLLYT